MVVSIMTGKKGRILQAFSTMHSLVIRKTRLYDFSTMENAREPFDTFSQFMACKLKGLEIPP
jgi:hypothetical protein